MEELLEDDGATLATLDETTLDETALEETPCELASDDAVLASLLAGAEVGATELSASLELFTGVEDGATELIASLELLSGVEDGATELTTTLELLTATELLLFGLSPEEPPPPPHAVNVHNTEHRMPAVTFFM